MTYSFKGYTGVLGGSFNPPHIGHLFIAAHSLAALGCKKVLVIPCAGHPFGKELAEFHHRFEMCKLAFCELPSVEISDIENRLGMPSFTINTLKKLVETMPNEKFLLLLGADQQNEFERWRDFEGVKKLADIFLHKRGGFSGKRGGYSISEIAFPKVSSTEIRKMLANNKTPRGLLPEKVMAYIKSHGLYGQ